LNLIYRISVIIIRIIFRLNGGLEIKGKENIPGKGGLIVASNHVSYLDPPLIGAAVQRRATFMARKGLFKIPVLGCFIKHFAIPVKRGGHGGVSSIKEALKRLKRGGLLVIFPEGMRSTHGEFLEAKRGIGMLVSISNAPVVPAFIAGSYNALPVGARWIKRARITVTFGKPLYFSLNKSGREGHENISKEVMNAIKGLKDKCK